MNAPNCIGGERYQHPQIFSNYEDRRLIYIKFYYIPYLSHIFMSRVKKLLSLPIFFHIFFRFLINLFGLSEIELTLLITV